MMFRHLFICLVIFISLSAYSEYGNLIGTNQTVTLLAGETFKILAHGQTGDNPTAEAAFILTLENENEVPFFPVRKDYAMDSNLDIIVGPCTIRMDSNNGYDWDYWCSYYIERNHNDLSVQNVSRIPVSSSSGINIILEKSSNLIDWEPVYSSSIDQTSNPEYIRTRVVNN